MPLFNPHSGARNQLFLSPNGFSNLHNAVNQTTFAREKLVHLLGNLKNVIATASRVDDASFNDIGRRVNEQSRTLQEIDLSDIDQLKSRYYYEESKWLGFDNVKPVKETQTQISEVFGKTQSLRQETFQTITHLSPEKISTADSPLVTHTRLNDFCDAYKRDQQLDDLRKETQNQPSQNINLSIEALKKLVQLSQQLDTGDKKEAQNETGSDNKNELHRQFDEYLDQHLTESSFHIITAQCVVPNRSYTDNRPFSAEFGTKTATAFLNHPSIPFDDKINQLRHLCDYLPVEEVIHGIFGNEELKEILLQLECDETVSDDTSSFARSEILRMVNTTEGLIELLASNRKRRQHGTFNLKQSAVFHLAGKARVGSFDRDNDLLNKNLKQLLQAEGLDLTNQEDARLIFDYLYYQADPCDLELTVTLSSVDSSIPITLLERLAVRFSELNGGVQSESVQRAIDNPEFHPAFRLELLRIAFEQIEQISEIDGINRQLTRTVETIHATENFSDNAIAETLIELNHYATEKLYEHKLRDALDLEGINQGVQSIVSALKMSRGEYSREQSRHYNFYTHLIDQVEPNALETLWTHSEKLMQEHPGDLEAFITNEPQEDLYKLQREFLNRLCYTTPEDRDFNPGIQKLLENEPVKATLTQFKEKKEAQQRVQAQKALADKQTRELKKLQEENAALKSELDKAKSSARVTRRSQQSGQEAQRSTDMLTPFLFGYATGATLGS